MSGANRKAERMEKLMRRAVEHYRVSAFRGNRLGYCRVLRLQLASTDEQGTHEAVLKFVDADTIKQVAITPEHSEVILPLADFNDMYHLLQTEKPVFLTAFDEAGSLFCGLSTDPEPLGEGFSDNS